MLDIHGRKKYLELSRKGLMDILSEDNGNLSEEMVFAAKSLLGRKAHGIARIDRQLQNDNRRGAHN